MTINGRELIQATKPSKEEEERLNSISNNVCPNCKGPIEIGMEESLGYCRGCVEEAYNCEPVDWDSL